MTELHTWTSVYRLGSRAAAGILLLMPIQMVVFVLWPLPQSVPAWFELFQSNPLVGLRDMDLLLIVDYVLMALVFLALWAALSPVHQPLMTLAMVLEVIAVSSYMASAGAFEMLSLSREFVAAATDVDRSAIIAAGHAVLAVWEGTAFAVSYVVSATALLIASTLMLRSDIFTRLTARAGILAGASSLVPATAGTVGLVLSLVSPVPTAVWLFLVARTLRALSRLSSV